MAMVEWVRRLNPKRKATLVVEPSRETDPDAMIRKGQRRFKLDFRSIL